LSVNPVFRLHQFPEIGAFVSAFGSFGDGLGEAETLDSKLGGNSANSAGKEDIS
jgi:hypothetical protein